MSTSKFVMAQKLQRVQLALMKEEIGSSSYDELLPLIFKKCCEENLTFWFNFLEDACVLNLRDVQHENYELNIRHAYQTILVDENQLDYIKESLLINTFLITKSSVDVASSDINQEQVEEKESTIISNDKPIPAHIRKAIDVIQAKGIPVTREAIQHHLPLGDMSNSARMECNKYLKEMEA